MPKIESGRFFHRNDRFIFAHTPRLSDSGNSLSRSVYREGVIGFAFVTHFEAEACLGLWLNSVS